MTVKSRNKKKLASAELKAKSVKIKCCYCDISGECDSQAGKEKSEALGFITYCSLTPNKPKKQKKK